MRKVVLILPFFLCLISFDNTLAAELSGQVLYWDGGPARHVQVNIKNGRGEIVGNVKTNKYGYFSKEIESSGRYLLEVGGTKKRIYLSSEGLRVNINIHR